MSLKFFLTVYARLAGIAALVILACALLFSGLNSVRLQSWHEQMAGPLMRWLAATPSPDQQYPWMTSMFGLRTGQAGHSGLPEVARERLNYGHVVALSSDVGYRYLVQSYHGNVVSLSLEQPFRQLVQAMALLVRWHLETTQGDQRAEVIAGLAERLDISILPLQESGAVPGDAVLDRVAERGVAIYDMPAASGDAGALIRLNEGDLIQLAGFLPFNPWAWPVVMLLVLVLGFLLAVALLLAVRSLDGHLRKVESVAVRIARGEMGARVEPEDGTLVSRLAASFNSMAEHIQRLVQVQREMIHAVSHELRTPVARIRFGVQMIESGSSPKVLEKQLAGIDNDIQELDELIDEILTYARLEQGGPVFSLREGSVIEIVRQVVAEQQMIRPDVDIDCQVKPESERWEMSDLEPKYIHRALQNLVGNASRYAAGRVMISCHLDEENCRVDVEDDGPGIPEQDWEKVFTAFARLDDSRTRTSGGYGLGLSIVRRILYWHGGQAFVGRSEQLGGARFSLVWPRRKPSDAVL